MLRTAISFLGDPMNPGYYYVIESMDLVMKLGSDIVPEEYLSLFKL